MHPQLEKIVAEFETAQTKLHVLVERTPDALWAMRPADERWSVAENVEHLNRTAEAFLPVIREKLKEAQAHGGPAPARYRRDLLGWVLWKVMPPPVRRMRVKTTPKFVPQGGATREQLTERFDRLQAEQIACVRLADGLPIDRITMVSPVDDRGKYNLYSCLTILPPHQERHVWQSERTLEELERRGR